MFCARFWFKLFLKGKHALPKGFFFSVTTMKPVKRLRGTDLEVAKQIPETLTKGKGEGSKGGLSELLLSLWSHGQLSAKLVQEVAHKAILDGAQGQDLQRIAATGSFGAREEMCIEICVHNSSKIAESAREYLWKQNAKTLKLPSLVWTWLVSCSLTCCFQIFSTTIQTSLTKSLVWKTSKVFGKVSSM